MISFVEKLADNLTFPLIIRGLKVSDMSKIKGLAFCSRLLKLDGTDISKLNGNFE